MKCPSDKKTPDDGTQICEFVVGDDCEENEVIPKRGTGRCSSSEITNRPVVTESKVAADYDPCKQPQPNTSTTANVCQCPEDVKQDPCNVRGNKESQESNNRKCGKESNDMGGQRGNCLTKEQECMQNPGMQDPCNQKAGIQDPCHPRAGIQDPCNQKASSQDPCNQNASSQDPCNQKASSQDPCNQKATSQDPCCQKASSQDQCNQKASSQDPCNQKASSQDPCNQKATSQDLCCQKVVVEDSSNQKSAPESPSNVRNTDNAARQKVCNTNDDPCTQNPHCLTQEQRTECMKKAGPQHPCNIKAAAKSQKPCDTNKVSQDSSSKKGKNTVDDKCDQKPQCMTQEQRNKFVKKSSTQKVEEKPCEVSKKKDDVKMESNSQQNTEKTGFRCVCVCTPKAKEDPKNNDDDLC